jgi:5'-methylthioadenosine phosphorylase
MSSKSPRVSEALGIIGGSGLYAMEGFQTRKAHVVSTPFGKPSDKIIEGRVHGKPVFFLPRHGLGHRFLPTEVNYRANIYALKKLGVRHVFSVSAVGSLQEKFKPGQFVLVDQFFDRTKGIRKSSFFGEGIVGHVSMAKPVCAALSSRVAKAASELPVSFHVGGTYVCMEGPAFSTHVESYANHAAGYAVIGMTNVPEAYLAREAGLCYCTLAMVTDYDSWNVHEEPVNVETVVTLMKENVARAKQVLSRVISSFEPSSEPCACRKASQYAVMTDSKAIPAKARARLKLVLEA